MSGEDAKGGRGACDEVRERLAAYHYRDLEPDELGTVEGHLEQCSPCRAALEAVRETAAGLDALPVPPPSELDWARFSARLEARVAPLRAERLAARGRAAGRRSGLRAAGRIAAAVLVAGLAALSASLYFETRDLRSELVALQVKAADESFSNGDVKRAIDGLRKTLVVAPDPDVERRLAALEKLDGDERPLRAYSLARREIGERQRQRLAEFLGNYPRHPLADDVFVALQKRGDATPRPLEIAAVQPVRLVMKPLPGEAAAPHYVREIERLKGLVSKDMDPRFNQYALFRAARVAEEDLGDRARAVEEYRGAIAAAAPGAIRDAAEERLRALLAQR